MSVFLTKSFARFARKAGLANEALIEAASAVAAGQADADLGGGVFKQRVARSGGGKSGGFRTIILFKAGGQRPFAPGACQEEKGNNTAEEGEARTQQAALRPGCPADDIGAAVSGGALIEVMEDGHEDEEG